MQDRFENMVKMGGLNQRRDLVMGGDTMGVICKVARSWIVNSLGREGVGGCE